MVGMDVVCIQSFLETEDRSRQTEIEVFSLNGVVAEPWLVVGVRRDGLRELAVLARVICCYSWPDHPVPHLGLSGAGYCGTVAVE